MAPSTPKASVTTGRQAGLKPTRSPAQPGRLVSPLQPQGHRNHIGSHESRDTEVKLGKVKGDRLLLNQEPDPSVERAQVSTW